MLVKEVVEMTAKDITSMRSTIDFLEKLARVRTSKCEYAKLPAKIEG